MSFLCLVFLARFAGNGDMNGVEEGEVPLLSETLKTTYSIARSVFHSLICNRQGSFFVSVRLQRHDSRQSLIIISDC